MSLSRLLAIDYGEKRIGVALSDPLQIISRPYRVLDNSGDAVFDEIKSIIRAENVGKVIVGLPLNLAGEDTLKTSEVRRFAEKLQAQIAEPLILWDERYSTDEAHKALKSMKVSVREGRQIVDKIAASIILQDYLENHPA
ncbi:MAG TPA: Holliday junction resolvase RuvX [Candidatus Cloacimonadota bacterium]|nr:Holliday junction resolvase RuvX [Candidatus Cloacimonadota bacterium]